MKKIALTLLLVPVMVLAGGRTQMLADWSDCDVDSTSFVYTCAGGTGADDGWLSVAFHTEKALVFRVSQVSLASGNIEFTIEGRSALNIDPSQYVNFTLLSLQLVGLQDPALRVEIPEQFGQIRVGVRLTGTDDGSDTGADAEEVSIHYDAL